MKEEAKNPSEACVLYVMAGVSDGKEGGIAQGGTMEIRERQPGLERIEPGEADFDRRREGRSQLSD